MTTDYCNDCGEHVDECTCLPEETDMERKTPVDKLIKSRESVGRPDWECPHNDEWDRMCRNLDGIKKAKSNTMFKRVKGKGVESFECQDESYGAQCRHCNTVVSSITESHFECPCCHRLTRSLKPTCRRVKP